MFGAEQSYLPVVFAVLAGLAAGILIGMFQYWRRSRSPSAKGGRGGGSTG